MLFLHIFTSLDGYIEDANGSLDWMGESDDFDRYIVTLLQSIDGMIFGRVAHDLLSQYWPTAGERADARAIDIEMAGLMNTLPKYVLTRGDHCADWNSSHPIGIAGIAALKRDSPRDIALFAGAQAARSLLMERLVDSIHVLLNPILLGSGKPLFAGAWERSGLRLDDVKQFSSGIVKLRYELEKH